MDDLKFQKIIELLRGQLEWEIPNGKEFYEHVRAVYENPENNAAKMSVEDFVAVYRMNFKPGYPDHPTGGVFVDGHYYGEEGDMILIGPASQD